MLSLEILYLAFVRSAKVPGDEFFGNRLWHIFIVISYCLPKLKKKITLVNPPELEEWDCGIKDVTIMPQLKGKDIKIHICGKLKMIAEQLLWSTTLKCTCRVHTAQIY